MTIMTNTERLQLIENLERAFESCTHPYNQRHEVIAGWDPSKNESDWCNVCGAQYQRGLWLKPHWRDIIVRAVFKK